MLLGWKILICKLNGPEHGAMPKAAPEGAERLASGGTRLGQVNLGPNNKKSFLNFCIFDTSLSILYMGIK